MSLLNESQSILINTVPVDLSQIVQKYENEEIKFDKFTPVEALGGQVPVHLMDN